MKFQSLLFTMLVAVLSFAQVPTITSFSPASGNVGSSVTITGANFSSTPSNNTVYFGAVKASVSASTSTTLTVTVPVSATYAPITVLVAGKQGCSKTPFLVTNTSIAGLPFTASSFSTTTINNTGVHGYPSDWVGDDMAVGDFDLDGKVDVVKYSNGGSVDVNRNTSTPGSVSFAAATVFSISSYLPASDNAMDISVGDINNDGKLDIIVIKSHLIVLINNSSSTGTISFATPVVFAISSEHTRVDLSDVNNDGYLDFIYSNPSYNSNSTQIKIKLNSGDANIFSATAPTTLTVVGHKHFAFADVNNDNIEDLIVSNSASSATNVYLNTTSLGSVSFGTAISLANTGNRNNYPCDINSDGKVDLLTNYTVSTTSPAITTNQHTSGGFTSSNVSTSTSNITVAASGDAYFALGNVDGDNNLDAISLVYPTGFSGYSLTEAKLYTGYSAGSFASNINVLSLIPGNNTATTLIFDVDGDNKQDFVNARGYYTSFHVIQNNIAPPPIAASPNSLSNFNTCAGAASTTQSTSISGTGLSANITLTAPSGYEISLSSGSGFASTLTLTQSGGTVAATTIYVRLNSTATAGTYNGNLSAVSGSNTTNIALTGIKNLNTAGTASSTPTLCVNTSLTAITHATTGATGIGSATSLPAGVSASWSANTITISGTPTAAGTFNYTIPLTGGCGSVNATGTITVNAVLSSGSGSSTPGVCDGSAITAITHATTGATGFGYPTGLPAGLSIAYSNNTLTISGSASNTYNIGDYYNGGRIAYIFQPNDNGYAPGKVIIVDPVYKSVATCWTFGSQTATTSALIGEGLNNTNNLYNAGHTSTSQTIGYAYAYTDGVYSDWFIPSQNELNAILTNMPTSYFQWNSGFYIRSSTRANSTQTIAYRRGSGNVGVETFNQNDGGCANTIIARYDILPTQSAVQTFNYSIPLAGSCGSASATGTITITDSYTWTGATSTDPTNANNWNPAAVPCSGANEVIPSGLTNYPAYTNLTIAAGTTYTVQSGAKLDITGVLTNNGTLTIESGATLVQGTSSTLAGSGTYNVQQTITGAGTTTPTGRFWYLGSPVSLASSSVYFGNAANVVKKRDEVNNAWTALSSGTPENLTVGRGYYTQAMANSTINFTGGLVNNGAITISGLTRTAGQGFEGFNLVSNPYPSYLNWDAVTKTNVGGTMWYRTYDGTNMVFDTYVAGTAGGLGTNLGGNMATKWIPPMQSFWVRVNSGSTTGSLGLTNAMRSHFASLGGSTAGLRSTNDELKLFLRMNLLQADKKDQIIVYVNGNATNGFDQLDGEKMMQADIPQFYTKAADKKITINGLNSAKKQQALPITMELPTTGVHSFVIEDLEIDNGLVWLEDKQEAIIQALEPGTVYEFYANSGINAERFVLHFQLLDTPTPTNTYNEVGSYANFNGKGASVHAEAAGVVVIKLPASTEGITDIQIRDAAGKLVYAGSTNTLETSVQLEQANGIYYVTLNSASGVEVRKVFIQQ